MNMINGKRRDHTLFFWLLLFLLALITLRYAIQVNIPRAVFLAVIVLIALQGDQNEIITLSMCCIPMHESIDFFYAEVFCIAVFVLKFWDRIRFNWSMIPIFLMILWELLHCFGGDFGIREFLTNFVPLLLLLIMMSIDTSVVDYEFLARMFAFVTVAVCASLIIKVLYFSKLDFLLAINRLQRLGMDSSETKQSLSITGGEIHPNILGVVCVLATTGLMQLRSLRKGRPVDMVMAVVLIGFGTLTASRTFLVCLALMVVLLMFSQKGSAARKLQYLGGVIAVLLIALGVMYLFFPAVLEYFFSRFQTKDITTGRIDLFAAYNEFIFSSPVIAFFGIGLQDFGDKLLLTYRVADVVPHNGIQEVIIAWGFPGALLFLALLLAMVLRSRRQCRRPCLLGYVPLLILLAKAQAGQMLNSGYTMMAFSYAYLSMAQDFERPSRQIAP